MTSYEARGDFKKLIALLAVSTGGGLLLGASLRSADRRRRETQDFSEAGGSIRLGGETARREGAGREAAGRETEDRISLFLRRLETLERKIEAQTGAVHTNEVVSDLSGEVRHADLHRQISSQLEGVEARLMRDLGKRNAENMEALRESMLQRVERRIEPLEAEIAAQRTSIGELGEYSIRTEHSLQRLLEGLDKLVAAQTSQASQANGTGPTLIDS